jgi:hypothetical protein
MQMKNNLKMLLSSGIFLVLSLMLGTYCQYVAAAQKPVNIPTLSVETYRRVLDIVFPRDTGNFKDFRKEFALTLRYKPSFGLESQVNITKYSDDRLEVVTHTLPKGSRSIWEQLNTMLRQTGREDAEEMAKHLNVQKTVLTDTVKVRRLLSRFAAIRISPQLDASITLDGTYFELWYEAVSNESYHALVGGDPGHDRTDHPLIRWMNEVRQAVLK